MPSQTESPRFSFLSMAVSFPTIYNAKRLLKRGTSEVRDRFDPFLSPSCSVTQIKESIAKLDAIFKSRMRLQGKLTRVRAALGPSSTARLVSEVHKSMASGSFSPTLTSDGTGGVYIITTHGSGTTPSRSQRGLPLAIFKPSDEEFMAPANPRGYRLEGAIVGQTEHPITRGFKIGSGASMEAGAYLLDAAYNHFSGVPPTILTQLELKQTLKTGSIQAFVPSVSSAEDMGTQYFDIAAVHKIGILDCRLFNTDRHAGNILLSERRADSGMHSMTPIDHGLCAPSVGHLEGATFDWLVWPQTSFPFSLEASQHIASLDVEADAALLRSLQLDEDRITTVRLCTTVLKVGAAHGFSLHSIATGLVRASDGSQPSPLELWVAATRASFILMEELPFSSRRQYGDALVSRVSGGVVDMLKRQRQKKPRSLSFCATKRYSDGKLREEDLRHVRSC